MNKDELPDARGISYWFSDRESESLIFRAKSGEENIYLTVSLTNCLENQFGGDNKPDCNITVRYDNSSPCIAKFEELNGRIISYFSEYGWPTRRNHPPKLVIIEGFNQLPSAA